ncbi:matrixin family metalloprotease [Acinetobacter sp. S40]|nr:matrixin family metalloprotease [Acinetobacter sp. S40]
MRWFILIPILCVLFFYLNKEKTMNHQPFDSQVHYRIGQVDPRFGLSEQQIIVLSQQASYIWQNGTGKSLFIYDPNAQLRINFIYDERQADTKLRLQQFQEIKQQQQLHSIEQQHLQHQQQQLNNSLQSLDQQQAAFQTNLQRYNLMVQQINQNGGATPEQRIALDQQKQSLQQQQTQLQQAINTHNFNVEHINHNVDSVNQIHQEVNQNIQSYNYKFQGRLFHKGEFDGKQINIYEFESQQDLVLTLAHELGHALGLQHNQDPKALMYPILKQQDMHNFRLQPADLAMLPH